MLSLSHIPTDPTWSPNSPRRAVVRIWTFRKKIFGAFSTDDREHPYNLSPVLHVFCGLGQIRFPTRAHHPPTTKPAPNPRPTPTPTPKPNPTVPPALPLTLPAHRGGAHLVGGGSGPSGVEMFDLGGKMNWPGIRFRVGKRPFQASLGWSRPDRA